MGVAEDLGAQLSDPRGPPARMTAGGSRKDQLMRLAMFFCIVALGLSSTARAAEQFLFEDYFRGRTVAEGSFRAINGVSRKFTVDLHGRWNGRTLTLVEDFVYDDGERDRKTWRFTKTSPTTYVGTREDVLGETVVTLRGRTARFSYKVYLEPGVESSLVTFYDRMTLRDDGTVINRALVTKWGLPVAWTKVDFRRP
jgi:hypothetical protein